MNYTKNQYQLESNQARTARTETEHFWFRDKASTKYFVNIVHIYSSTWKKTSLKITFGGRSLREWEMLRLVWTIPLHSDTGREIPDKEAEFEFDRSFSRMA